LSSYTSSKVASGSSSFQMYNPSKSYYSFIFFILLFFQQFYFIFVRDTHVLGATATDRDVYFIFLYLALRTNPRPVRQQRFYFDIIISILSFFFIWPFCQSRTHFFAFYDVKPSRTNPCSARIAEVIPFCFLCIFFSLSMVLHIHNTRLHTRSYTHLYTLR